MTVPLGRCEFCYHTRIDEENGGPLTVYLGFQEAPYNVGWFSVLCSQCGTVARHDNGNIAYPIIARDEYGEPTSNRDAVTEEQAAYLTSVHAAYVAARNPVMDGEV